MDLVLRGPSDASIWARGNADGGLTAAYQAQQTVTRPANVTPYTALDVLGGRFEIPNIGPAGGLVRVMSASLMAAIAAVPAGMTNFRLHLYNALQASNIADNAAFDLTAADRASYQGYIDLPNMVDMGATLAANLDNLNKIVKLAAGQTSLWAYLVTTGGFTPAANSEVYTPTLGAIAA
jgi:hypothetical protein